MWLKLSLAGQQAEEVGHHVEAHEVLFAEGDQLDEAAGAAGRGREDELVDALFLNGLLKHVVPSADEIRGMAGWGVSSPTVSTPTARVAEPGSLAKACDQPYGVLAGPDDQGAVIGIRAARHDDLQLEHEGALEQHQRGHGHEGDQDRGVGEVGHLVLQERADDEDTEHARGAGAHQARYLVREVAVLGTGVELEALEDGEIDRQRGGGGQGVLPVEIGLAPQGNAHPAAVEADPDREHLRHPDGAEIHQHRQYGGQGIVGVAVLHS